MTETITIKYLTGVATLPQMVIRARNRASDVVQQMAGYGYSVEIVEALAPGTLAETGYYKDGKWNGLGSWLGEEPRPSLWAKIAAAFSPPSP